MMSLHLGNSEQAQVRDNMNSICGSRIFKRSISSSEKVAFTVHLKSTKFAVLESVKKRFFSHRQTLWYR